MFVVHWRALNTVGMTLSFCSDLSFSATKKRSLHSRETKWNIDPCAYWPALTDVPFVSYRLFFAKFISFFLFFFDVCLHKLHSFREKWCFYLLSFAQKSFNSSTNMDSFYQRSPAHNLTGIPSLFLFLTPFSAAFPRLWIYLHHT